MLQTELEAIFRHINRSEPHASSLRWSSRFCVHRSALAVPMLGFWGLHDMTAMGISIRSDHPQAAKTMYVLFLLAFGLFCALAAFGCLRYMYRGREKAKLPPNHRL